MGVPLFVVCGVVESVVQVVVPKSLFDVDAVALFGKEGVGEQELEIHPGSVYCSCLCPVRHQVRYRAALTKQCKATGGVKNLPGLGEAGVSIIFRTSLFGKSRGTTVASLPSPHLTFKAFAAAFDEWLRECPLYLPTMADVAACVLPEDR